MSMVETSNLPGLLELSEAIERKGEISIGFDSTMIETLAAVTFDQSPGLDPIWNLTP